MKGLLKTIIFVKPIMKQLYSNEFMIRDKMIVKNHSLPVPTILIAVSAILLEIAEIAIKYQKMNSMVMNRLIKQLQVNVKFLQRYVDQALIKNLNFYYSYFSFFNFSSAAFCLSNRPE